MKLFQHKALLIPSKKIYFLEKENIFLLTIEIFLRYFLLYLLQDAKLRKWLKCLYIMLVVSVLGLNSPHNFVPSKKCFVGLSNVGIVLDFV